MIAGFYWTKWADDGEWEVAQWDGKDWFRCGSDIYYSEDLIELGPLIEPPCPASTSK